MQTWQLFIVPRHPANISVTTVCTNPAKLTNDLSIIDLQALYLSGTYCHKTGTRPLAVVNLNNRQYENTGLRKLMCYIQRNRVLETTTTL